MTHLHIVIDFPADGAARVEDRGVDGRRLVFRDPVEVIVARSQEDVVPALQRVERATLAGSWAAGFLSYESAPAFEPAMAVRSGGELPLLMFGIYEGPTDADERGGLGAGGAGTARGDLISSDAAKVSDAAGPGWVEQTSEARFLADIARIQEAIAAGETYQVNYTNRLRGNFTGDAFVWYEQLRAAQGTGWHAFIDTDVHTILSASPELFFEHRGERLITRPMKGTRPRGRWLEEDEEQRAALIASEKDRAENLMIVDLLRNDAGRIAETGTVHVTSLFEVERYHTVWQLTSRIEATLRSNVGLTDLFRALFPCGSVTGAPKINTMKWIAALEDTPREVYCGAIGVVRPGGDCTFSVPIRTVWIDKSSGTATYGTGSGVTADSDAGAELEELRAKAAVLRPPAPAFELLETMRAEGGIILRRERHMRRLHDSARYFGFAVDAEAVARALDAVAVSAARVRVRVATDSTVSIDQQPAPTYYAGPGDCRGTGALCDVALSKTGVSSQDVFLCHKTTNRAVYESRRRSDAFFDTLLWNERSEITEFTIGNVVLEMGGALITPARTCGLLAGMFREELLESGTVTERVVRVSDLQHCSRMWLVNSVRGWVEVRLAAT
ncbi:MAG: aminodeoxychorismate synthase component I [Longimicrobiales bacterium]